MSPVWGGKRNTNGALSPIAPQSPVRTYGLRGPPSSRYARLGRARTGDLQNVRCSNAETSTGTTISSPPESQTYAASACGDRRARGRCLPLRRFFFMASRPGARRARPPRPCDAGRLGRGRNGGSCPSFASCRLATALHQTTPAAIPHRRSLGSVMGQERCRQRTSGSGSFFAGSSPSPAAASSSLTRSR